MNAKQAIFDELGDLFGVISEDDDGGLFLTEEVEGMQAVNEDEPDDASDASDAKSGVSDLTAEDDSNSASDDEGGAGGGAKPPDLFDSIYSTAVSQQEPGTATDIEGSGRELTDEERDACIEAATDAITETKMSPEALDWGLNFIQRMYDEKNAKIRERINSIDWASAKARWEQEDAEEASREMEEREQFLKG